MNSNTKKFLTIAAIAIIPALGACESSLAGPEVVEEEVYTQQRESTSEISGQVQIVSHRKARMGRNPRTGKGGE